MKTYPGKTSMFTTILDEESQEKCEARMVSDSMLDMSSNETSACDALLPNETRAFMSMANKVVSVTALQSERGRLLSTPLSEIDVKDLHSAKRTGIVITNSSDFTELDVAMSDQPDTCTHAKVNFTG